MAATVTLVNLTGFQWGVAADETALNIREFKTEVEPEILELLPDKQNMTRGFAAGSMKKDVSMSGEISGSTGLLAASAVAAFAPVNSSAYFGAPTTGLYLRKGTVTEGRAGWKDVDASLQALAGVP